MSTIPTFSSVLQVSSSASANAVVQRDSNADASFRDINTSRGLNNSGYTSLGYVSKTTSASLGTTETFVAASAAAGTVTLTLPAASTCTNRAYFVTRTDSTLAYSVVLDGNGAETIDGAANLTLGGYESIIVVSDGTGWISFGRAFSQKVHSLPLNLARKPAAIKDVLEDAAGSSIMGLADDPSSGMTLVGESASGASKTNAASFLTALPAGYLLGSPVTVRIRFKVSAAATVTTTVDLEAYVLSDGAAGSDICATSAITNNTTSYSNCDFTITPTTLVDGSMLLLKITAVCNDTGGTVGAVATIAGVQIITTTR